MLKPLVPPRRLVDRDPRERARGALKARIINWRIRRSRSEKVLSVRISRPERTLSTKAAIRPHRSAFRETGKQIYSPAEAARPADRVRPCHYSLSRSSLARTRGPHA